MPTLHARKALTPDGWREGVRLETDADGVVVAVTSAAFVQMEMLESPMSGQLDVTWCGRIVTSGAKPSRHATGRRSGP